MSQTPLGCERCHAYAPLTLKVALWLCYPCLAARAPAPCATGLHAWHGAAGTWVCHRCGATLPLVAPPAPPPPPPVAPVLDWGC